MILSNIVENCSILFSVFFFFGSILFCFLFVCLMKIAAFFRSLYIRLMLLIDVYILYMPLYVAVCTE